MESSLAKTRRVVITGMGLVSPLGNDISSLWSALQEGRSGVRALRAIPSEALPVGFGAEAWDFEGTADDFGVLDKQMSRAIKKGLKVMCREIQMGVAAAQKALGDARLTAEQRAPERTGVVYGSDYIMTVPEEFVLGIRACVNEAGEFQFERWASDGIPRVDPLWLLKYLPNMPASHVAIFNDLRGPNNSLTLREASANLAVAEAYCTIERGHADVMIAGATGTRIHPVRTIHVALQEPLAHGDQPERLCRPFDHHRTGMVLGEGAGALVLEDLQHAEGRGATILGEIVGYGSSTVRRDGDAVASWVDAIRNAIRQALQTSGKSARDIGHVHAHGLATRDADVAEARALAQVFGERAVRVTAAKSYFGNLGAGGGLVELIASVLSLHHGIAIPVLNYETPDPECPVTLITERDVPPGDCCLNVNFTPQGQASAVIVQRWTSGS